MRQMLRLVLLMIALTLSAGAPALAQETAAEPAWGTRPYAVEKPLFDALFADLETKIAAVDARIAKTAGERDAYWQDWSDDERLAAREWFQRSSHYPSAGNRLNWAKEQSSDATQRLQAVLESGSDVDLTADTDLSMARRERVWSAQITQLRRKLAERNEQAIYDGIELQTVKSYLRSLLERDLGVNLEEFAKDVVEDSWYVVRAHADKFWDDMFDCAVKMIGRDVLRHVIGKSDPDFKLPPDVPGVVSPPDSAAIECLGDIMRSALVNAFTAALRKDFVDRWTAAGIYPEVAEYWWATFILAGESETGPNAPRVKPVVRAIADRLLAGVERTFENFDQTMLEQMKEVVKRDLEVEGRKRLIKAVQEEALNAVRAAQSQGQRLAGATLRMESVRRAKARLGPELFANDWKLRFADTLDALEVLLRQGVVYYSVTTSEDEFNRIGKPLVDEYWEVVRCLGKLERGSGAHLVLQFYGWDEDVRREFFDTCAKAKEAENLPEAQMMADRMAGIAAAATSLAQELRQHCSDGNAALKAAEGHAATIETRIDDMGRFVDNSLLASLVLEGMVDGIVDDLAKATSSAEDAERAKKKVDAAAERACDLTEQLRSGGDPAGQADKLDQIVAAAADAREQAEASSAAARGSDEAARRAVTSAEQVIQSLVEIQSLRDVGGDLAALFAEAESSLSFAEREAAAATAASEKLAARARDGAVLIARARQLLGMGKQTEAVKGQLSTIEALYAAVQSAAGTDDGCAKKLAGAAAALRQRLVAAQAKADAVKARIETELAGSDIEGLGTQMAGQAEQASATGDVALAIAEAAQATAADAATCLELARAARQGGEAEIIAAGRAAIAQCDFPSAKAAIERLSRGAERQALLDAYRAAMDRELETVALWKAADGAYLNGEYDSAYATLEEAWANTQCDAYKARIAEAMTRVLAAKGDALAAQARAAIANCDFAAAEPVVQMLEDGGWPVAAELRAALDAAVAREDQAYGLYEQGGGQADLGNVEPALAALRQAQGLTQCAGLKSEIAALIATLRGTQAQEESTQDQGEVEPDSGVAPVTPTAPGTWSGPWRGTLQLRDLVVNGQRMGVRDLAFAIEREWQNYVARRAGEGNPLAPMEIEIAGKAKDLFRSGLLLLQGPVPLAFALQPEGNGYRFVIPGAPPPSEDNPPLVQIASGLPLFLPDGRGGLRATLSDKGSVIHLDIAAADAALSQLNLGVEIQMQVPPDTPDASATFNIRSLVMALSGSAGAGQIGYGDLLAEYQRLLRERAGQ